MMPWYWRIEYQWMRFVHWLDDHLPTPCQLCREWTAQKNLRMVQHRTAGYVWICPVCRKTLFGDAEETD